MRIRSWVLAFLAFGSVFAFNSCSTGNKNGTTASSGFLWVATQGDQMVSSYSVDLSSGAVSSVRSSVSSGINPTAIVLSPDGATLFVANVDDNCGSAQTPSYCDRIRPFPINPIDGTIGTQGTAVQVTTITSGTPLGMALGLAVDPGGKFLFVTHQGNSGPIGSQGTVEGTISVFSISGTNLSAVGSPISTTRPGDTIASGPTGMAIPNAGGYLYIANEFSSTVSAYSYDANGNLTFLANYPAASNPTALAFSRTVASSNRDSFLFVSATGSNQVRVFSACVVASLNCGTPTGALSELTISPFSAPTRPGPIIVDPAFDWVYVIEKSSFQVSEFSFASATGALSPLAPPAISTGSGPVSGGVTSDGNWVFIANSGASNLSALKVDTQGKLSPANAAVVILSNQPSAVAVR
jgi:6-phosphogluconolactonase (cycloisomerase 2 family)